MSFWTRLKAELFGTAVGQADYEPANGPSSSVERWSSADPALQKAYDDIYGGTGYGGLSEPPPEAPASDPDATQPG